jgi:hypothetical protein
MDNDVILSILCVNLLPEFNAALKTLTWKFQWFGEGRRGQRQYCYD